jgi:hypothetical protein
MGNAPAIVDWPQSFGGMWPDESQLKAFLDGFDLGRLRQSGCRRRRNFD